MTTTSKIPVGPVHVALEEPMYFRVDIDGETVRGVDINAGHVHRGIEYLTTKRTMYQNVVLTERICSLCSNSHPETFCMAAEQIAGIEIPERAAYLRVISAEVKRIASHLFNVGILAHLTGYDTLFMHAMQVREIVQDLKETVFGNRMDLAALCIGGVRYDLDAEMTAYFLAALDKLTPEVAELAKTFRTNGTILRRTKGVGVLTRNEALACGVVGPVARASGIDYDVRVVAPYAAYDRLNVPVPTLPGGDVWSRAMIRLTEVVNAIDLIRQVLRALPEGPTHLNDRPDIPEGRAVAKCEAPRGELIYFLKTSGADEPERVRWRVPSFMNWDALRFMFKGAKLADIAIIVNSIDPCVSCTER
jgi:Ni,Fe-hydrogenase III large subunit